MIPDDPQIGKVDTFKCACVSMDAHECARIRDGRNTDPFEEPPERRACECECHKDEYEDDWDDDWVNPVKRT
jgi:hypothetical protein